MRTYNSRFRGQAFEMGMENYFHEFKSLPSLLSRSKITSPSFPSSALFGRREELLFQRVSTLYRRTLFSYPDRVQLGTLEQKRFKSDHHNSKKFQGVHFNQKRFELNEDGVLHVTELQYKGKSKIPLDFLENLPNFIDSNELDFSSQTHIPEPIEESEKEESALVREQPTSDLEELELQKKEEEEQVREESRPHLFLPDKVTQEERKEISLDPLAKQLFDKYHGTLFSYQGGSLQGLYFSMIHGYPIAWHHQTALYLLFFERVIEGSTSPEISASDFLNFLKSHGIVILHWKSNVFKRIDSERHAQKDLLALPAKDYSEVAFFMEMDTRLNILTKNLTSSCEILEGIMIESKGSLSKLDSRSKQHILLLLMGLVFHDSVNLEALYRCCKENGIEKIHFRDNVTTTAMSPIFRFHSETRSYELIKSPLLMQLLQRHQALLEAMAKKIWKHSLKSEDQTFPALKIEEREEDKKVEALPATSIRSDQLDLDTPLKLKSSSSPDAKKVKPSKHNPSGLEKRLFLSGYATFLRDPHSGDKWVTIHLPDGLKKGGIEDKRRIVTLALKVMADSGEESFPSFWANVIIERHQMSKMNLPRDIMKCQTIGYSDKNHTIRLQKGRELKELCQQISEYQMTADDISKKMISLLPIFRKVRNMDQDDVIRKNDFLKLCREHKVSMNFTRDFKPLWGSQVGDHLFLSSHVMDQVEKLNS